jgi:hypothetical protein
MGSGGVNGDESVGGCVTPLSRAPFHGYQITLFFT